MKLSQKKVFSEGDSLVSVMDIAKRMLIEALKDAESRLEEKKLHDGRHASRFSIRFLNEFYAVGLFSDRFGWRSGHFG